MGPQRMHHGEAVPLLSPRLPDADALLPYLRRIDATRMYSNGGPLVDAFEKRVCAALRLPEGTFVAAASGTSALIATILATAGARTSERPLALIPAFTFVATAAAAERSGYVPYLLDIDAETWTLEPEAIANFPQLERVGLVVPVAPFGRLPRLRAWKQFADRTGIPVVIDGAASFDVLGRADVDQEPELPIVFSFNATKSFGTGEGGGIAVSDVEVIARIRNTLNFGLNSERSSDITGLNAKMSEYHAAVGLAELDGWARKRSALQGVADGYRAAAVGADADFAILASPRTSLTYVLAYFHKPSLSIAAEFALRDRGIGTRRWYGRGLRGMSYLSAALHEPLPITDGVAASVIGLPVAPDLTAATIARVIAIVKEANAAGSPIDPRPLQER